jgi:hypothetical protein
MCLSQRTGVLSRAIDVPAFTSQLPASVANLEYGRRQVQCRHSTRTTDRWDRGRRSFLLLRLICPALGFPERGSMPREEPHTNQSRVFSPARLSSRIASSLVVSSEPSWHWEFRALPRDMLLGFFLYCFALASLKTALAMPKNRGKALFNFGLKPQRANPQAEGSIGRRTTKLVTDRPILCQNRRAGDSSAQLDSRDAGEATGPSWRGEQAERGWQPDRADLFCIAQRFDDGKFQPLADRFVTVRRSWVDVDTALGI